MSNLLLIDLNDSRTKDIASTITSDTSRKILSYLASKEKVTSSQVSKDLGVAMSTVSYHLSKLVEAKLVESDEFTYSKKGREINHYKLANKYIIIAPKKVEGLREKLKGLLPVGLGFIFVGGVVSLINMFTSRSSGFSSDVMFAEAPMAEMAKAMPATLDSGMEVGVVSGYTSYEMFLMFIFGGVCFAVLYLLFVLIREKVKK